LLLSSSLDSVDSSELDVDREPCCCGGRRGLAEATRPRERDAPADADADEDEGGTGSEKDGEGECAPPLPIGEK
jgi:hypothetical protein